MQLGLDSGASRSIINEVTWNDLGLECELLPCNIKLIGVTDHELRTVGTVRLPLQFGGMAGPIDHTFIVVRELGINLLGEDFFKKHSCTLKWANMTLRVEHCLGDIVTTMLNWRAVEPLVATLHVPGDGFTNLVTTRSARKVVQEATKEERRKYEDNVKKLSINRQKVEDGDLAGATPLYVQL